MLSRIKRAASVSIALALAFVLLSACGSQSAAQPAAAHETARPLDSAAPQQSREVLNSERIEQRFGSYGVEVLHSDDEVRVSNLYSGTGDRRVGRTFAVVFYAEEIDPLFTAEHAAILDGNSIGAVFARSGWTITKRNRYIGEIESTAKVAALMQDRAQRPLAVHVYVLNVAKDGAAFDYATIAEIHHPDYLRLRDVESIYGAVGGADEEPDERLRRILKVTAERMQ